LKKFPNLLSEEENKVLQKMIDDFAAQIEIESSTEEQIAQQIESFKSSDIIQKHSKLSRGSQEELEKKELKKC